ncbi:SGNH/GDSL hydrolase family protein [Carnobacterium gallinarum]|uniref:SGNH/GDSL hydrolase family protein n=1 Tax=Carnobacterium gallinarum TaxID=2749 RepID=UPI000558C547|nr:SGNH/GDSL hydrolase family protein [Carnobacterium gallinarum]
MKRVRSIIGIVLFLGVVSFLVFQVMNVTTKRPENSTVADTQTKNSSATQENPLKLVAIGDSLTEGVGDSTSRGGYVPLVAGLLEDDGKNKRVISTSNYGIAGNRSDQILKRIKKDTKLQMDVKKADVIVLTVGGNDLMKVVQSELLNVKEESFVEPEKAYQERVKAIFSELRGMNSEAPLFIYGIYNPFYLYFSDITEMQDVVTSWNKATEAVVKKEKKAYFIPINDLLYKGENQAVVSGLKGNAAESSSSNAKKATTADDFSTAMDNSKIVNNLLFEEDRFHPNDIGYGLMAQALYEKMLENSNSWEKSE